MCLLSYLPGGTILYTSARPYPPFRVCRPIRRTSFPDPPRFADAARRPGPAVHEGTYLYAPQAQRCMLPSHSVNEGLCTRLIDLTRNHALWHGVNECPAGQAGAVQRPHLHTGDGLD